MKTSRTCVNGPKYYKTTDCPTCPVCEEQRKPKDGFLALLSAPSRRALEANGITTLKKLSTFNEKEVLKFHGIGPSSIPKLKKHYKQTGSASKVASKTFKTLQHSVHQ